MEQVLRNLLSNALKFSEENSTVTVRVGFQPSKKNKQIAPPVASVRNLFRTSVRAAVNNMAKRFLGGAAVVPGQPGSSKSPGPVLARSRPRLKVGGGSSSDDDDGDENWVKGALVVTVTDTGAGISKENQKLLFREGQQFDPHKLQGGGGSGFGLFISRSIVVLHGGRIEAYSAGEGEGTSFSFTVPMRRAKADMDKAELDMQHAFRATSRYCTPAYRKPPGAPTFSPIQHALTRIGRPGPPCTHCKPTAMCRPHQRKVQTRNGGRRSACRCPGKGHN